jgi:hypothetical protein
MQRKAMTQLMGSWFRIVYRKCKENVVADVLSRVAHLLAIHAVSSVQPAWIQVLNSDAPYPQAQQLLQKLAIASPDAAGFILHRGLIRHNNNIQIGQNSDL